MSVLQPIVALFGRTDRGLLAAQVEELSWLASPDGANLRILSGWRIKLPMSAWTRSDFCTGDGVVPDEQAFRAHVEEVAEHRRQLRMLPRTAIRPAEYTPWGPSQHSTAYADGITSHSTAGHGGFHVELEQNLEIDARLRNQDGWYEEDAEWAKVAFTFPALFTTYECRAANRMLRNDQPDAWEAILGVVLLPGESRLKDERQFRRDHARDWVVISAVRSSGWADMVECLATRGGLREKGGEQAFLVPSAEYSPGRFGFVIDQARHSRLVPPVTSG
jgi:hypothetical protein